MSLGAGESALWSDCEFPADDLHLSGPNAEVLPSSKTTFPYDPNYDGGPFFKVWLAFCEPLVPCHPLLLNFFENLLLLVGPLGKSKYAKHTCICVGGPAETMNTFSGSADGRTGTGALSRQTQREGQQKRKLEQVHPLGFKDVNAETGGFISPYASVMQGQFQSDANEFARAMHESARKDRKDRIRELNMLLAMQPHHAGARAELLNRLETPLPDTVTFVKSWLSSKSSHPPSKSESVNLVTPTRESRSVLSDESCERVSPTSEESSDMSTPLGLTNQMSCEINL